MKIRSAVLTAPKTVEIREYELPPVGPRQVLIKVKACAICTWEQRFYTGSAPEDYPFRGGHEVSGVVVEKGAQALCDAQEGDIVGLSIMNRCGVCDNCRRGMDNFCENDAGGVLEGAPWGPGGMSDYVLLDDYMVYRASECGDFGELSIAEPVACVLRSVALPNLLFGDTVMVQGAGIMGLLHVALLNKRGVRILVSEPDETRRNKALEVGAAMAVDPLEKGFAGFVKEYTSGRGMNAVYFTAGGGPAIIQALPLIAPGGWLCLYGSVHPKGPIEIDPNLIHYNEIFFTGTFSHTKHSFRQAVSMLSQSVVDVSPFITERIPFPEVERAFERAIAPDTYRVVLTFD